MLPSKDYFKIFNLEKSFNIDLKNLKNTYFELNKKYHPDVSSSSQVKIQDINSAYKVLKDDFLRAKYLSKKSMGEVDQRFLYEVLELEDEIEHANKEELNALKNKIEKEIDSYKKNYNLDSNLTKWGYYRRLAEKAKDRDCKFIS